MTSPLTISPLLASVVLLTLALGAPAVSAGSAAATTPDPDPDETSEESGSSLQSTIGISGQIRHRSELDARRTFPDDGIPDFHLLRTRLNAAFTAHPDIRAFIQIQDARLYGGSDPQLGRGTMDGSAQALDFHQAFFSIDGLFGSPFAVQLGRQELDYGNERLIGSVGWSNIGRTFDAGVLSFGSASLTVDAFAARLVGRPTVSASQNLLGAYATWRATDDVSADGFLLFDNDSDPVGPDDASRLGRYTTGTYLHRDPEPIGFELEAAYQFGNIWLNPLQDHASIHAHMLSAAVTYLGDSFLLRALFTRLSGDGQPADDTFRTFNTLFATNHKFYGYMDYFPALYQSSGLDNYMVSLGFPVSRNTTLTLDIHHFETATPVSISDPDPVDRTFLGQEVDLTIASHYASGFAITAGASVFFASELMEAQTGKEISTWFYLMTTLNF